MQISEKNNFTQFVIASLIFFIGLALFTINTLHLGFGFGVEESRYILFAQEMLRSGVTPFPLLYGQAYPDYPATHTFLIYLFSLLFHQVTPFTAILPSAIASALILAFTYRIAAIHSNQWALYAILFLLATYEFILLSRLPSPDPLLAAVTVISFYFCYSQTASKKLTVFLLFLSVVGFLIRGPMGLVIPLLVSGTYYFFEKNYREFFTIAACGVLLLIGCSVLQLFVAQQTDGVMFAKQVFFMELGGRINELGQRPVYYYLLNNLGGYALAFPVALITVTVYFKKLVTRTDNSEIKLLKQVTAWAFIILLAFSFPHEKHFRYIIPAAPAFALIASFGFVNAANNFLLLNVRNFLLLSSRSLPFFSLIFIGSIVFANHYFHKSFSIYAFGGLSLFSLLAVAVIFCQIKIKELEIKQLTLFGLGVMTLLTFFITIAQPLAEQNITSVKPLADKVSLLLQPQQKILLYQINPDREGLKFAVLLPEETTFVNTQNQLTQSKNSSLIIASQKSFDAIDAGLKSQFNVLWQEKLARNDWVVFTKKPLTPDIYHKTV